MAYDREGFDKALLRDLSANLHKVDERAVCGVSGICVGKTDMDDAYLTHFAECEHTNVERLAYYRSHGLIKCDDYPGGDMAFEADVLSGKYHDEYGTWTKPGKEDAYIIDRMNDGKFKFTVEFSSFGHNPYVYRAFLKNCRRNGFCVS